ncbi:hypothetical protein J6590_096119, partial [Homalodisca vitripennis]
QFKASDQGSELEIANSITERDVKHSIRIWTRRDVTFHCRVDSPFDLVLIDSPLILSHNILAPAIYSQGWGIIGLKRISLALQKILKINV